MSSQKLGKSERAAGLGQRLSVVLAERGLSQTDLALRLGIPPPQISDWVLGKHRPSKAARALLSIILNLNEKWLTEGIGTIYKEGTQRLPIVAEAPEDYGGPKRRKLVRAVKRLVLDADDAVIEALLKNVEQLSRVPKKEG